MSEHGRSEHGRSEHGRSEHGRPTDPLLEVSGLTVRFGHITAVDGATFTVAPGERVGVVGESGSGKSTLALSVMQLLPPSATITAGDVKLAGTSLSSMTEAELSEARGSLVGMVFQDPLTSFDPLTSVGGHLRAGLKAHGLRSRALREARAIESLRGAGMPDPAGQLSRYPHELSGGLRQRSLIALGLENEPRLLVADEPTTALDVTIQAQIIELFGTIGEAGPRADMSLLIVSHNLGLIRRLCTRVIVMYAGSIVEDSPADEFFAAPLHPYAAALQAATPRLGHGRGVVQPIPGQTVDLGDLPPGCAFAPRCTRRIERCEVERPPLADLGDGRRAACWNPVTAPPVAVSPPLPGAPTASERGGDVIVDVRGATKTYRVRTARGVFRRTAALQALAGVDVSIRRGETLALVGESGSGKSTLAKAVLGLMPLTSGAVSVGGEDPRLRGNRARREQWLQAVFQDPHGSLNPHLTVAEVVAEPLVNLGVPKAERSARVAAALDSVRLPANLAARRPQELSGGQAQRVAIARALAPEPQVIVLDEPTASLDVSIQTHVVSLLRDLQRERDLTYLFVSHDLAGVREIATEVAVMYLGRLVERAPWAELFSAPQHPYTVALLSAVPSIDDAPGGSGRIVLHGEPPSPLAVPSGCPFHPRCPVAQDRCATEVPELATTPSGATVACHFPGSLELTHATTPRPHPAPSTPLTSEDP